MNIKRHNRNVGVDRLAEFSIQLVTISAIGLNAIVFSPLVQAADLGSQSGTNINVNDGDRITGDSVDPYGGIYGVMTPTGNTPGNIEFITRGSTAVALVKQNSFYVLAYMEETKLEGVRPGYRAEITPLGSNKVLKGRVDSIAAGVTNASSTRDDKGMATIDSNLEWVRLAQRVPVRIQLDDQQENLWPAGTTATVVITGKQDRDENNDSFFRKMAHRLRESG